MGQIRKINGVFYIEFFARGLLYSQIGGNNYEESCHMLEAIEAKIASGEVLTIPRYIDLTDFQERFLVYAHEQWGVLTVKRFEHLMRHWSQFLFSDFPQITQLAQVTPFIVESYKVFLAKTLKFKYVNWTLLLLREIFEFGIKLGFINDNPTTHIRLLACTENNIKKITARYLLANEFILKGTGLGKLALILKISDIGRLIYFTNMVPLSRIDTYN